MPVINHTNPDQMEWINDASHLWGIPLHPLGEMNLFDYYLEGDDVELHYKRFLGGRFQITYSVLVAYIITYCVISSSQMIRRKPRHLVSWCCFIPSILSAMESLSLVTLELGVYYTSCRLIIWLLLFAISISNVCNSLILLHKAYLVLAKAKWIIYASIVPLLLQFAYMFVGVFTTFTIISPDSGCVLYYPSFVPWYWIVNAIPLNMTFSVIFSYIGWKYYSRYGSDAWRKLMKDGIQVMLLVALCNICCCIIAVTQMIGSNSDLFLVTDCIFVNAILIIQHKSRGNTRSSSQLTAESTNNAT
ncbi:hypothetical protein BDF22DRAFT_662175 [Syncephalis plumigaleata]|nr:hypothetical protein BDF22DRAFT_662175 [Syncephalis plumigaleata]